MWLFAVPQLKVLAFPTALFLAVVTAACNKINKPNLASTNASLQVLTLPHPGLARWWVMFVHMMLLPRLVLSARCELGSKDGTITEPSKIAALVQNRTPNLCTPHWGFWRSGKNCFKTSKEIKKWCKAGEELSSSWCAWGIRCPLSLCLSTAALKPSQCTYKIW